MTEPQLKRVHIFQLLYFKGLVNAEVQISVILVIPFFIAALLVLFSPTTGFLDVDLQPVSCVRCQHSSDWLFVTGVQRDHPTQQRITREAPS
jgi:hypothetical protein